MTYDADQNEKNMQVSMRIDIGYEDVKVTKSGTCYGYDYDLEWTQTSGDLPTLTVCRDRFVWPLLTGF